MGTSHTHDQFDFFSLLLVLLIVAFLILLGLGEFVAAIVIGIALLILLAVDTIM